MAADPRATPFDPTDPVTLVVVGAGGDLTTRLLLPGLGRVLTLDPQRRVTLVGAARTRHRDWTGMVRAAFESVQAHGQGVDHALAHTRFQPTDVTDADDLAALLEGGQGRTILYFAVAQTVTQQALGVLAGLDRPPDLWLALEKPFGTDEESARSLNDLVNRIVPEHRVFRVDHFLGMPACLNLVGLRLANRVLEPLLNREHVAGIEIVFDEALALEGRADFYDATGAIRDMLQSHLLQVMGLVMMPPPGDLDDEEIPALIAHLLRHTHLAGDVAEAVLVGRYTAGEVDGHRLPSYLDEPGVDPGGRTETFARLTVRVDTWRWDGVPVVLRSGKAVGSPRQEILVRFKPAPHRYDRFGDVAGNVLRLGFQDGRVHLELQAGAPQDYPELAAMTLSSAAREPELEAYGQVVRWLLAGTTAFSVLGEAAEHGWRIVAPAVDAVASGAVPILDYPAGSSGPASPGRTLDWN